MPILTHCPTCRRQLRVPDELLGRNVKCPDCLTVFVSASEPEALEAEIAVAAETEAPAPPAIETEPDDLDDEYDEDIPRRRRRRTWRARAREEVAGPAIGLVVVAAIDVLLAFYLVFVAFVAMAENREQPGAGEPQQPPANRRQFPRRVDQDERAAQAVGGAMLLIWGAVGLLCGILTMVSGLLMKSLRGYGLAMTCCALTVIPCTAPCFVAGIPIGIWGLIVLSRHEVRAAFG